MFLELVRDRKAKDIEMNSMDFFLNYDKIITYDFNYMNQTEPEETPYENIVDKAERHLEDLDARSSMVGDIYMDRKERKWYIVKPVGFQEITWINTHFERVI